MQRDVIDRPKGSIKRNIYISWDEALEALEDIRDGLGLGNCGRLFARNDVKRLKNLARFIERQIDEHEKQKRR